MSTHTCSFAVSSLLLLVSGLSQHLLAYLLENRGRKSGMKAWDLFENVPAPVMCMHPRVTLWQKIYDGIVYRFPRVW